MTVLDTLKITAMVAQFRRYSVTFLLAPLLSEKVIKARDSFFATARSAVNQRLAREEEKSSASSKSKPDIIGLMLRDMKNSERMTEPELVTNSILIVGGGAETTATCLSATMYHLCKTPRVMQKLKDLVRSNFDSPSDITLEAVGKMDYLKATVDEALRIFPVASYIAPRTTPKQGHVIAGEVVPGNTYVGMGQWYMGRSSRLFHDPLEFRPERFTESQKEVNGMTAEEIMRPFSLGPRNCVGKLYVYNTTAQ
jgi:aspirochlorine biosynthesis cytochrome P450 monooxygenase